MNRVKTACKVYIAVKLKFKFILFRFSHWSTTPWVTRVKWVSSTGKNLLGLVWSCFTITSHEVGSHPAFWTT